jgi:hypothetical protein
MALTSLADLSIIDANNTSFSGITQAENSMLPSNVNDAFRATDGSIARYLSDLAGINQTVGGTANAITVTVAQTWTALANGQRMAIKNTVGPNTGATTIAVTNSVAGALGTKAIRLQGDSALVGGEMLANGIYEFRYDTSYNAAAGAWVLLNPAVSSSAATSNAPFTNFAIGTPTVAASALTIPFTGLDGNALSASNVAYVNFRSATAGSGAISLLTLNSALASLVISSGSTLGMTNGVAATLALAIFNDAGTARPAIINPLTLPLVDGIASATSEGGAGAADSAGVWYSNAAITSKAFTIVAYITVTEATAGTWATAPSTVQVGPAPAVANALPMITPWVAYTPTFTGLGTVTGISCWSRRVGDTIEIYGRFTTGTCTAVEPKITMGFNGTNNNITSDSTKVSALQVGGVVAANTTSSAVFQIGIGSGVGYMSSIGTGGSNTGLQIQANATLAWSNATLHSFNFKCPITGW